jgi:hypothetical protein
MRFTLRNLSGIRRKTWAVGTAPAKKLGAEFGGDSGLELIARSLTDAREFRAHVSKTVGHKSVVWIEADLDGGEELVVELATAVQEPEPFQLHPWVSDSPTALLPTPVVQTGGGLETPGLVIAGAPGSIETIEQSAVHTRLRFRQRVGDTGIVFEWTQDLTHGDPVSPFWGRFIWSDRTDPKHVRGFNGFGILVGEHIAIDDAEKHGVSGPFPYEGRLAYMMQREPFALHDGAGLAFRGRMLTTAQGPIPEPKDDSDAQLTGAEFTNLAAAAEGGVEVVSHDWDGVYIPFGVVPKVRDSEVADAINEAFVLADMFRADREYRGWFATRPLGMLRVPSSTGDQEDFGAAKGGNAVSFFRPEWLSVMRYSVYAEAFRGFQHFDTGTTYLDLADHPQLVTWSGFPHYSLGVSPDQLGKTPPRPSNTPSGWTNYDDQHYSRNNVIAYALLSDDPIVDALIEQHVFIDEAAHRVRYNGRGAARAQGRVALALAGLSMVTDGRPEGADRSDSANPARSDPQQPAVVGTRSRCGPSKLAGRTRGSRFTSPGRRPSGRGFPCGSTGRASSGLRPTGRSRATTGCSTRSSRSRRR